MRQSPAAQALCLVRHNGHLLPQIPEMLEGLSDARVKGRIIDEVAAVEIQKFFPRLPYPFRSLFRHKPLEEHPYAPADILLDGLGIEGPVAVDLNGPVRG